MAASFASVYSRYRSRAVIEVDGRRSIEQRPDVLPMEVTGGAEHVVVGGETLDMLAARYYGHEQLWWRIADANDLGFLFELSPGDRLVIPPLRVATATTATKR